MDKTVLIDRIRMVINIHDEGEITDEITCQLIQTVLRMMIDDVDDDEIDGFVNHVIG